MKEKRGVVGRKGSVGRDGRTGERRGEDWRRDNTKEVWKSHIEIYLPTGYKTYIKI